MEGKKIAIKPSEESEMSVGKPWNQTAALEHLETFQESITFQRLALNFFCTCFVIRNSHESSNNLSFYKFPIIAKIIETISWNEDSHAFSSQPSSMTGEGKVNVFCRQSGRFGDKEDEP